MTDRARTATGGQFQIFTDTTTANYRWRLLSGNNREVGRSASTWPTVGACVDALAVLRAELDRVTTKVRRAVADMRWEWQVMLDGAAAAVSSKTVDRAIRCELAVDQFLVLAASATLRSEILVVGGRRRHATVGLLLPSVPDGDVFPSARAV